MKQWDRFREIPRDYQQLSVSDKQKLLSYLAFRKFEQSDNFILFEEDEIQGYITEHLGIETEESEAVLKAIEAYHGLLIEQAGFWSFSHLTFQEYFVAKHIVDSPVPEAAFQSLVSHITEPHWREVFLLTVEMLDSADVLLRLMKERIDKLLAGDEKLQQLLDKIYKIYSSQEFPFHFPVPLSSFKSISLSNLVVHSLYFECELRYIHDIALGLEIEQYQNQYKTIDLYSCYSVLFSRKYALKANCDIALRLEPKLGRASTKHMDSTFSNPIALKLFKLLDPVKRPTIYKIYEDENNQKNSSIFGAERAWWKTHGSS